MRQSSAILLIAFGDSVRHIAPRAIVRPESIPAYKNAMKYVIPI